jgi:hypothetical protein
MKSQEIERLLEKYYQGETTLEEERLLDEYFARDDVPARYQAEKLQFDYLKMMKGKTLDNTSFDQKVMGRIEKREGLLTRIMENRPWFYATVGMAATILILLAVFIRFEPMTKRFDDTYSDPEMAYNEAKKVLFFVSQQFNRGTEKLEPISTYDDGVKELNKINALNEGISAAGRIKKYNKIEQMITKTN